MRNASGLARGRQGETAGAANKGVLDNSGGIFASQLGSIAGRAGSDSAVAVGDDSVILEDGIDDAVIAHLWERADSRLFLAAGGSVPISGAVHHAATRELVRNPAGFVQIGGGGAVAVLGLEHASAHLGVRLVPEMVGQFGVRRNEESALVSGLSGENLFFN